MVLKKCVTCFNYIVNKSLVFNELLVFMSINVMKSGVPLVEKIIALRKKFCKLKMNTKTFFLQCSLEEVIQNPGKKKIQLWFKLKVVVFPFSSRILKLVSVD